MLLTVGEAAAGKGSRSLAQHIPGQAGMEGMKVAASGVAGDLARARIALDERGQKLGELEDRSFSGGVKWCEFRLNGEFFHTSNKKTQDVLMLTVLWRVTTFYSF